MIVFKIAGQRYNFPTSWEDLTYSQYVALLQPMTLKGHINLFTGIPLDTLEKAELKNLEKISISLAFMSLSPHFDRTPIVSKYILPEDVTIHSLGQFEDLRGLLTKFPKKPEGELFNIEDNEIIADLYLHACAIYVQKIKDGKYDYTKVPAVKEELKSASCAEVIGTGAFFLFKPLNISPPTTTLYQKFLIRTKRLIQGLPGYQRTLDFLLHSSESRGK